MRFVLTVDAVVGVNRTLTAWLAPTPARANGVPDTTLNGAATDAVPDTVPPAVFVRVTVCSAKLPRLTLPKFSGPVGLKANSARATALTSVEQALSRPEASTALTAARQSAPAASPVSLKLTHRPGPGLGVGEATRAQEDSGRGELGGR